MVRQRGLRVPADEIFERKVLEPLPAPVVLAIDAETKSTGVRLRLKLHAEACRLDPSR
jgi:hypothetical protein